MSKCGFVINDQGWIPDLCGLESGHEGPHVWEGEFNICADCGLTQIRHHAIFGDAQCKRFVFKSATEWADVRRCHETDFKSDICTRCSKRLTDADLDKPCSAITDSQESARGIDG